MAHPRTLPHRPEAENAVLGGILLRGAEALSEALEHITEEDFYQPRAMAVFRAMRILKERGEPIDVVTLEVQLRKTGELELCGGIEGIAKLDRYATAHNVKAHAELIAEAAQVRKLVIAGREIAEEGMQEVEDARDFVARARVKVVSVADSRTRKSYRHASEVLQETVPVIVDRKKRNGETVTGVSTGLVDMDALTNGLQPSDLIILAAPPSMGKTAFALNIALNASVWRRKHMQQPEELRPILQPVLFFSLEMAASQLMERALAAEAEVDFGDIRSTAAFGPGDFERVVQAATRIQYAPLAFDDQAGLSIDEARARAWKWRNDTRYWPPLPEELEKKRKGAILFDYLQLARGGKKHYNSREQEVAEISRGLKGMAKDLKMPVIALSQLNRSVATRADHRPQMSDLRESGAIEQDADVIIFVHREERYLAPDAPEEKRAAVEGKAEAIVPKQRNGATGTVHLLFDGKKQRFRDLVKEDRW